MFFKSKCIHLCLGLFNLAFTVINRSGILIMTCGPGSEPLLGESRDPNSADEGKEEMTFFQVKSPSNTNSQSILKRTRMSG